MHLSDSSRRQPCRLRRDYTEWDRQQGGNQAAAHQLRRRDRHAASAPRAGLLLS